MSPILAGLRLALIALGDALIWTSVVLALALGAARIGGMIAALHAGGTL